MLQNPQNITKTIYLIQTLVYCALFFALENPSLTTTLFATAEMLQLMETKMFNANDKTFCTEVMIEAQISEIHKGTEFKDSTSPET